MRILTAMIVAFTLANCGKSGHQHDDDDDNDDNPNRALYDQVWDIHDEVMPRLDEIETLKREIKEKISNSPDMIIEKRQQLEQVVSNLDSAGSAMMNWMHKFAMPDSTDGEKAREYLESEMERIKQVRNAINESIEKAKEEVGKN